jgi:hypothetical protein
MECAFVVGQKVSCVLGFDQYNSNRGLILPKVGDTYTIRTIFSGPEFEGIGVYLVEIRNRIRRTKGGTEEPGFEHTAFRPVTDLLADFMAKRKMLTDELIRG